MPEMKKYLCEYRYGGSRWSFTIDAESHEDAKFRLQQLKHNATVSGRLMAELPNQLGWPVKLTVWVKNLFRKAL